MVQISCTCGRQPWLQMPLKLRRFPCQPLKLAQPTQQTHALLQAQPVSAAQSLPSSHQRTCSAAAINTLVGLSQSVARWCTYSSLPRQSTMCAEWSAGRAHWHGICHQGKPSCQCPAWPSLSSAVKRAPGALRSPKAPAAIRLESAHELPLEEAGGGMKAKMPQPWLGQQLQRWPRAVQWCPRPGPPRSARSRGRQSRRRTPGRGCSRCRGRPCRRWSRCGTCRARPRARPRSCAQSCGSQRSHSASASGVQLLSSARKGEIDQFP